MVLLMVQRARFRLRQEPVAGLVGRPVRVRRHHGPFFPQCGGITDQTVAQLTQVTGLVNTAQNSVGCQWLAGGGILGPHFSFSWYRGSPIGRERKTEELSRSSVEDINIDGHGGFIAVGNEPTLGDSLCEIGIQFQDDFIEWSVSFTQKPFPDAVRRRQGTHPPIDCEFEMSAAFCRSSGAECGAGRAVVLAVLTVLTGCSQDGRRHARSKAGAGDVPRNSNSEKQYPNLLKECEVLTNGHPRQDRRRRPAGHSEHVRRRDLPLAGGQPGRPDRHHPVLVRAGQPGQRAQGRREPEIPDREPLHRRRARRSS